MQNRVAKAVPDSKEKGVMAKLLVPSNQIGCLLGKGGSIIGEMRKVTGAYIRILGKDQMPKSASENEEVVQVFILFQYFCVYISIAVCFEYARTTLFWTVILIFCVQCRLHLLQLSI